MSGAREIPDVLIPFVSMNASGGVRMALGVANELAARGRYVAVSVPDGSPPPPLALHEDVERITRPARYALRARLALAAVHPAPRVIVATGYQTPVLIALGALTRGRGSRLLHLIQNDEPVSHVTYGSQPSWIKPLLRLVAAAGYRVPARRIAVSHYVATRVGTGRVHRIVPPGIEPVFPDSGPARRTVAHRDGRVVVGVLSHPARVKGVRFAIDAFESLRGDARTRFVVFDGVNAAPAPPFVEPFSRLAPRVGLRHDIVDFFALCDVFVFPSLVEGFGLPPLEAMACGAAVVLTDSGGVREYARDGENCLLVPPGDAAAIANAIRALLDDPALRGRLQPAGAAVAQRFPARRFAAECADEIERLL